MFVLNNITRFFWPIFPNYRVLNWDVWTFQSPLKEVSCSEGACFSSIFKMLKTGVTKTKIFIPVTQSEHPLFGNIFFSDLVRKI